MTGGTSFCLWLSEKITKRGLGNGSSMLIVAGILASFPKMVKDLIGAYLVPKTISDGAGGVMTTPVSGGDIATFIGVILILVLIIVGVVFMEGAQRKIPIQYAGRSSAVLSGRRDSSLPIKLNSASVIPVIFASTLLSIPTTIANFIGAGNAQTWLIRIFSSTKPIGFALYIILIYLFSFFYSFLQINPDQIAENLQKQNAYIPGVRPGDETASYISRVLFKITMVGATYLTIVAIIPIILSWIFALPPSVQIGGTGLIIVVGVALETTKQIKSETEEKEYKGLLS
jgi:preprotein translocase subunit SecY